jgi:transposase
MKPFIRTKTIGGHEYQYEITPYYDKATKKIRQRSKYLGVRTDDGEIRKVRQKLPKNALAYGEFIPYRHIIDELRLDKALAGALGEERAKVVLVLAMNRASRPLALQCIETWYEGTILAKKYGDLPLSSQNLSKVLTAVGASSAPYEFCKGFMRGTGSIETLVYDITSLSSYSQLMGLLEYGYERDELGLPQVNLSVALDKERGIPVMFDLYPGSITDVTTVANTLAKLKDCGAKRFRLVLDRGFFSSENILEMLDDGLEFVIPAKTSLNEVKALISRHHRKKEDPALLQLYQGRSIFVRAVTVKIKTKEREEDVDGYLYYDLKRAEDQKDAFYKGLHRCKEAIEAAVLKPWQKPAKVVARLAGWLAPFVRWRRVEGNRLAVTLKPKAVAQHVNKMGFTVILHDGERSWDEALVLYREKDIIEKAFRTLKHDLEAMPMNVRSTEAMKGFVFVTFVALIIRFRLLKMLKDADLVRKWSVDKLLLELEKIKKIEMDNGELLTTEVSKKQRELLAALGLCA